MTELIEGTQPEGLTPKELAEYLYEQKLAGSGKPVSAQTIRTWKAGGMPCESEGEQGGAPSRFDPDKCVRWLKENRSGLGRGGHRDKAGRPSERKRRNRSQWREPPSPLLEGAEKKKRANERIAELGNTSGAEALADPDVIALERQACKLTHHDLVLLAHLVPEVSGLSAAAIQRLEKLETIQSRQLDREKAMGRLMDARLVEDTYARAFNDLRAAIDASAADTARALAAMLELDGEGHKKVEKLLKERAAMLVASLREVGQSAADAA